MTTHRRLNTYTGLQSAMAGCRTCHGDAAFWFARNAVAVAARHADAHPDHEVWAEQVISITYNRKE